MGGLLGGDNFRIPRKNEMVNTKANTIGKGWKKGTTDHDFQNKTFRLTQSPKDIQKKKKKTRNHQDKQELPEQV